MNSLKMGVTFATPLHINWHTLSGSLLVVYIKQTLVLLQCAIFKDVKCVTSLNMGETLPQESYGIRCNDVISGHISYKIH